MPRGSFRRDERGQTLVIVGLTVMVLLGFLGLVADIAWYQVNLARVQRAADAGALAGVVYLPTNVSGAVTAAKNESMKNGFQDGVAGVSVTATPDANNDRILRVEVAAPVHTYFAQLLGFDTFGARRSARAGRTFARASRGRSCRRRHDCRRRLRRPPHPAVRPSSGLRAAVG